VTAPSRPQTNGQAERFNRTMGRILDHYVAEHSSTWDTLHSALTFAYNKHPHAATKVAPFELVNPLGVASWSIKDLTRRRRYPATAQRGTHAEKKEQAAFLTRLVRLIPRIREALAAAQQRYKRNHDARIRPQPTGLEVGGFAFKRHHDYNGSTLGHRAQGPFRVVHIEGPTAVLDIKGEHRRENIVHLVRDPSGPPAEPALHPSMDATVRPHGPRPDGHTYHIDQILDHADGEDGRLLVKVTWTGYEEATWEDASVAPHETLRLYLRCASRRGLLHTAADRPPGVTGDNDAAAEAGTAPAPSVAAEPGAPAGPDPPVGPPLQGARPGVGPRRGCGGRRQRGATPASAHGRCVTKGVPPVGRCPGISTRRVRTEGVAPVGRRPRVDARQGRSGGHIASRAAPPWRGGARRDGGRTASGAAPQFGAQKVRNEGRSASRAVPRDRHAPGAYGGRSASGATPQDRRATGTL